VIHWVIACALVAIITGASGFGTAVASQTAIAQILFFVILVLREVYREATISCTSDQVRQHNT